MKGENVKAFSLIIIESLPDDETKTGFNLYSSIITYKRFQEPNLSSNYYDINNTSELYKTLEKLVRDAIENNFYYILHFEVHGYEDGISLKNGDKISWKDLIPYFRELNIHYRNYLCIYLAVCKGASIIKYINPADRAPFRVLISSARNIYLENLIVGFEEFYNHLFFSLDAEESLKKYNSVIEDKGDKLVLVTSKYCFDQITDIDRETFDKNGIIETCKFEILKQQPNLKTKPIFLEKLAEQEVNKIFDKLKTKKDYFLMTDLQTE